ncbi:hypothetical protein SNE40_005621 [Patella caerulea]|uniref:Phospholipase n=1 Tax=Patella caerulea TaxID=87958 RepID=A0AAN8K3Z1_PATCE
MNQSGAENTTRSFLRSVSVISEYEDEDEFSVLSAIDEIDTADGDIQDARSSARIQSLNEDELTLPFTSTQKVPTEFDTIRNNCWIPRVPIEVEITGYERQGTQVLNPNLYKIVVKHGNFTWAVKKRYKHFRQLHEHLLLYRAKLSIPMPTKTHKDKRKTFNREKLSMKFPSRPEALVHQDTIPRRMELLQKYLQNLLKVRSYREHNETIKFFEVSPLSFVSMLGSKGKEGMIKKCSGGRSISIGCCGCLRNLHVFGTWNKRWLIVKDSWLAYIRPEDGHISDVLLMDSDFRVQCGMASSGAPHGVLITTLQRNLLIKCWTSRKAREWAHLIEEKAKTKADEYTTINRFEGFAPLRDPSYAHWFADAASYFEAVAESLDKAKEEIFITDWWLSPEIYMKRPITEGDKWRLDMILKRKAEAGVKIYILLYKEVTMALGIDSAYSKSTLLNLHPTNIKIMRHPDHLPGGVLLWAHHEKMVVIDQNVAFIGGIDLCYGRWDTAEHKLKDLGSIQLRNTKSRESLNSAPVDSVTTETTVDMNLSRDSVDAVEPSDVSINIIPPTPDGIDINKNKEICDNSRKHSDTSSSTGTEENAADKFSDAAMAVMNNLQNDTTDKVDSHDRNSDMEVSSSARENNNTTEKESKKNKQHLWKLKAEKEGLHFNIKPSGYNALDDIIPSSNDKNIQAQKIVSLNNEPQGSGTGQKEHAKADKTNSGGSQTSSQNSQSDLMKAAPSPPSSPSASSTGMAAVAKTVTMLNRLKKQEHDIDSSDDDESNARKRWKMVLNMKKFQSSTNQDGGGQETINEKLLLDDQKSSKSAKFAHLVDRLREKRGSIDQPMNLLQNKHKQKMAETNKSMQRTDSETKIDELGLVGSTKLWIGKDYVNFIFKDFVQLDAPFTDFIDRNVCPRMPWHDIGAVVYGKSARDVARHFITRWNYTKTKKFKKKNSYPFLLPKTNARCTVPMSIKGVTYEVKSQILRSSSSWSAGIGTIEASIHTAYIHCIENAKHYIYIENQFFVTLIEDETYTVLNGIGEALYRRIIRAHRCGEEFRVYVVMPLLPAFEGEFGTSGGTALQAVTNWNYASICRGRNSLIERLSKEVADPLNYVVFCGLRTWAELNGRLVSELIYVHSKLMIVDDDTVIIGSANINDRSMLGKRDSELAVMVEDIKKTPVRINGREHFVGRFASSLRTTLFREHLGLSDSDTLDITDIVRQDFYKNIWLKQAAINTTIYDTVFKCIPCDYVRTFKEMKEYWAEPALVESNPTEAFEKVKGVKGYLVLLPREFLKDENLEPAPSTKEYLLPSYLWT